MNKKIINYFLPYKLDIIISLISSLFVAGGNLLIPLIVKDIINKVLIQRNSAALNFISIGIIVLFLIKGLFFYLQNYFSQKIALKITTKLKKDLYEHIIDLPLKYFREKHSGDITSYIINDLNLIQSVLSSSFFNGILDLMVVVGSISFLFIINSRLALFSFVLLPFLGIVINYVGKLVRGLTRGIQDKMGELTSHLADSFSGISVIFTFSTQEKEKDKFNKIADEVLELSLRDSKLKSILPPLVELSLSFGLTFVLWVGGRDVMTGNMTSGDLIAFLGYLVLAASPLTRLSNTYYSIKKIQGAFERLFDLLETEKTKEINGKNLSPVSVKGQIDFVNVSFSYGRKPIFSHINLTISPGEKVALVGPNGAGKSTLLHLILRLFEPTEGKISLDGIDIRDIDLKSLRRHIGIVLQDTHLFPGTIYDNIVYGSENVSKEKLRNILDMLGFNKLFERFPDGIYTRVGESGVKLSGGERHRISLARTLVLDPEILLLDEATSSLDPSSRREFQMLLSKVIKDRTTIFITHYKEEIEKADRILLVKDRNLRSIDIKEVEDFFEND